MEDVLIGVIGAGGRGEIATHVHRPGKGSRVVAACDVSESELDKALTRYGDDLFVTRDYRELLQRDLDAVIIATPDFLHEEQAVAALEAGKGVYLEKPMAITIEGCDRILRAAQEHGERLYVGHNMRHMPAMQKMKSLIDSGAIGNVKTAWCRHFVGQGGRYYFHDWHAESRYSTGLLLQKAAHDIDVLHWLCGGYTREVTAMGDLMVYGQITDKRPDLGRPMPKMPAGETGPEWPPLSQTGLNPRIDVEDVSMMLMRLDNGVLASYQQCHFTPDYWRNYTFIGDQGRIENVTEDFGHGAIIKLWDKFHNACDFDADATFRVTAADGGHGGSDPRILGEFISYIRDGGATITSPLAARYSVATGVQATASIRQGSVPLTVPPVDPAVAAYFRA